MYTKEDKLKAVDCFMTKILIKDFPEDVRAKEMISQFIHLYNKGMFPEFSDIWGSEVSALDDITPRELKELTKEYTEGRYKGEHFLRVKVFGRYVRFNNHGMVPSSRKNGKTPYEKIAEMDFDLKMAIASGVIEVEEVWE